MKKIKYDVTMLGTEVNILTSSSAEQRGFKKDTVYKGKLRSDVDWLVGCPVFENEIGMLGLDYDCDLVQV